MWVLQYSSITSNKKRHQRKVYQTTVIRSVYKAIAKQILLLLYLQNDPQIFWILLQISFGIFLILEYYPFDTIVFNIQN